jgi:hypothetical protein
MIFRAFSIFWYYYLSLCDFRLFFSSVNDSSHFVLLFGNNRSFGALPVVLFQELFRRTPFHNFYFSRRDIGK